MNQRPLILLLGASGTVGRFLLPRLTAAGAQVLAVSRRPPAVSDARVTWIQHDLQQGPAPAEAGVVVSAGPLRYAAVQAGACLRLSRVVALSSASVLFKTASRDPVERDLMQALLAAEAEISALCEVRGIPLTLFRPCMIYGGGSVDGNVSRLAALLQRLPVVPVTGRGLRQPVHADDLARIMLAALEKGQAAGGVFALGGGETLDYVQLLKRIGASASCRVRIVRVPLAVLSRILPLLHGVGRLRDVRLEMLRRQAQDLIVDDQAARDVLGWAPRPFRP